jgi:protease-4
LSLETDLLIDRRRLKRRLLFWRVAAVAALVVCVILIVSPSRPRNHIARLSVKGEISDTTRAIAALRGFEKDDTAKALIVSISSPGGSVQPSSALHDAIAHAAGLKPVVAVMGSTAASGGFMIAMPARRVFASPSTITGSIGVIVQLPEFSGLMEKLGVTAETLTSGALKDQPNPAHRLSDAGRVYLQALVADMYDQFVEIVAKGRHMEPARVRELADGRAFTGRQALALGLIDQLGNEQDATAWLTANAGVADGLPVAELRTTSRAETMFAETLGPYLDSALKTVLYQGVALDGAKALWQP